jgi:hypothetical protein
MGSGRVSGLEGVRIEDCTLVKSGSETARVTPQLLRVRLLPDRTRNFNDDEGQEAPFLLEHFIAAKAALNYHRDPRAEHTAQSSHRDPLADRPLDPEDICRSAQPKAALEYFTRFGGAGLDPLNVTALMQLARTTRRSSSPSDSVGRR